MGDIVIDTEGEFFLRAILGQFVIDGLDLVRSRVLAGYAVTAADQDNVLAL